MNQTSQDFDNEIAEARRYGFGKNWSRYLKLLSSERIAEAERSLTTMLGVGRLDGKTFLDIGSGSGLFSLAARRLGATVTSFDFDPDSVACAEHLRESFYPDQEGWTVKRGSVLDVAFMDALPKFDVVYSWGVLHHTGHMHDAVAAATARVAPGGLLFIALYRKTWLCPFWRVEKRLYIASPPLVRSAVRGTYHATLGLAYRLTYGGKDLRRGMDADRDLDDWLGGYPYESITPRDLKAFVSPKGFALQRQTIKSEGVHLVHGCDEFVFRRVG
jgi:2-polyprenyl-6-hydroxyphenyl methylase/3-demethylubiquinone-9 3-methyltransferase